VRAAAAVLAVAVLAVVALAGCGDHKPSPYATANTTLLDSVPVYHGAGAPKTTGSGAGNTEFASRDWALPATARATTVIDWYVRRLQTAGWKVTGKSFDTIRATRRHATISVGVRARTLEVIANSRGA
jgi:hypothetical protein